MGALIDWAAQDLLTIRQAGCLIAGEYPSIDDDRFLTTDSAQAATAIRRAIGAKQLKAAELWIRIPYGGGVSSTHEAPVPSDAIGNGTVIARTALIAWCGISGQRWPFPDSALQQHDAVSHAERPEYPAELRAAIEAFDAVSRDPTATKGKSAKAALLAWLEANRPALSNNARERIATVANWQSGGGAPATPG